MASDGTSLVADILATKVRCALGEQLDEWASESTLDRMVSAGLLAKIPALVRYPLLKIEEPLDVWLPDDHPSWRGDPEKLAYQAQSRWRDLGTKLATAFVATPKLARRTGGVATGEIRQPLQVTHDVHLLECWRALSAEARDAWEGEDHLRANGWGRRRKVPDALTTIDGQRFAIEFAGAYDADRVREFQDWCLRERLPYVLF
ncbi:MAG: hypothetical protein K2X82_17865 [Gemmataceae bacterium]|nr:hypothetical protein [Gemmataceae bacterium]